jgi:hypothetical protein
VDDYQTTRRYSPEDHILLSTFYTTRAGIAMVKISLRKVAFSAYPVRLKMIHTVLCPRRRKTKEEPHTKSIGIEPETREDQCKTN